MAFVAANPGARERAQRIADCVNQCDAAVSRELQATRAMRDAANATNARLLAQRDELVAALENLVETHDAGEAMHVEFWNIARAALAKVQA
jgi:hypothetical protein